MGITGGGMGGEASVFGGPGGREGGQISSFGTPCLLSAAVMFRQAAVIYRQADSPSLFARRRSYIAGPINLVCFT